MKSDRFFRFGSRSHLTGFAIALLAAVGCDAPDDAGGDESVQATGAALSLEAQSIDLVDATDESGVKHAPVSQLASETPASLAAVDAAQVPIACPAYDCRYNGRQCALQPSKSGNRMIGATRTLDLNISPFGEQAKMVLARSSWSGYRLHSQSSWWINDNGRNYLHIKGGSCLNGTYDYHSESWIRYTQTPVGGGLPQTYYVVMDSSARRASCSTEVGGSYRAWLSTLPC